MRLTKITALTAVATFAAAVAMASPAQASTEHNGIVEAGEFGLYYSQGSSGLVFDMFYPSYGFQADVFPLNHSIRVDNNTASYRNRTNSAATVATGYNWTGAYGCLPAGYVGNASTTFRNTISSADINYGGIC